MTDFEDHLTYLRAWWQRHGSDVFDNADDWINSLTNVELLEALSWEEGFGA
jgi:hypothetical protein